MLGPAVADATAELPPFGPSSIFTEWGIDPFLTILTVWVAGAYLFGVHLLRARGHRWPVGRTISFVVVGMGSFYVATSSGLAAYDTTLLSAHMVQHMILSMFVPLALALGAPVTLALRVLPLRARRVLVGVLHSRVVKVLSFPPVAFGVFVLSPWLLYFTDWYDASMRSTYVHEMTHLHLVLTGSLFLWPMVGVDPVPGRVGYPFRMMLMVMTLPFHAFLGVTIMDQEELIAGEWFRSLPQPWLPDPLEDQHLAGGIAWGTGDIVGIFFFFAIFAQWVRSSMNEAKREDRRLDRLERLERVGPVDDRSDGSAGDLGGVRTPPE